MELSREDISAIVDQVVKKVRGELAAKEVAAAPDQRAVGDDGIFETIDQCYAAAEAAYKKLHDHSVTQRKEMIEAMRKAGIANSEKLAEMAVRETTFGRVQDKTNKNLLVSRKTPGLEDLDPIAWTGDDGLTLVEPAPWGVLGALTPVTNPAATIICNGIGMVAAGNACVFNPHPSAKGVCNEAIRILNRAIMSAGGPNNLLTAVREPTLDSSKQLMDHPKIPVLMITGGEGVVKIAMKIGKKVIAAGPGNPPVIVDETADIQRAGREIVNGASFDNCVLCTGEKEVFVVESMADALIAELQKNGAYLARPDEADKLVKQCIKPMKEGMSYPFPVVKWVGKDASVILEGIGVKVPDTTKLVIMDVPFEHPFVQCEQLMPVLPIVRVIDVDQAIEQSILAEHYFRHTASMYSTNVENMSKAAYALQTTIFVKNAPTYAGLGFGGEGYATLSIATPTGEGLTSPRSFTRRRRCTLKDSFRIV